MGKIVITDTDKFESIISSLEGTLPVIEDVFRNQNNYYQSINHTDAWSGETQQVISDKYDELSKNYDSINESLRNYIKYLKITVSNYKNFETLANKSVDENEIELNVN